MTEDVRRPVQYFSDEYLERCRAMKPEEVLEFLESFRLIQERTRPASRLISLKVPQDLLDAFRARCGLEGIQYQTQIKRLMHDWLRVGLKGPPTPKNRRR
jgi:predicted DNA binding CopG/RHH family protein